MASELVSSEASSEAISRVTGGSGGANAATPEPHLAEITIAMRQALCFDNFAVQRWHSMILRESLEET